MSTSPTDDWRSGLLAGAVEVPVPALLRNPAGWPAYEPRRAVSVWRLPVGAVAAVWDFSTYGGSFGEDDATALIAAVDVAIAERCALITLVRSGGTRLQEGVSALVGIPRARLAMLSLAEAGLPHLSVADHPTTGGVWISVTSTADVRVGVEGATVGFAGPRVVEAVTGSLPASGSHTATSAYDAGLLDALLPGAQVAGWVEGALRALHSEPTPVEPVVLAPREVSSGWAQVQRSRARTTGGAMLLAALLSDRIPLRAEGGDATVAVALGRLRGRPVVGVALAADVGVRPTPAGYRLAERGFRLAGRLGLPVVSLVDTPGAEPGTEAENGGIASAIAGALDAVLMCPSPTLALVHGEGGSGGALAAAATDVLLATPDSYFAAIGPEGASAALRRSPEECADRLRLTPTDLLEVGLIDAIVADAGAVAGALAELCELDPNERRLTRVGRWSGSL